MAAILVLLHPAARATLEQKPEVTSTNTVLSLVGIGAVLHTEGDFAKVMDIVSGGPAARDGRLKVNDCITAVAQGDADFVNCAGMQLDKIVDMIRGKKDTAVRLKVLTADGTGAVISLVRAEVKLNGGPASSAAIQSGTQSALSSDMTAKLHEYVKKITVAKRKLLADYMAKKTDEVTQAAGLNDAGKKALAAAASQAVDQSLAQSESATFDLFQKQFRQVPSAQLAVLFSRMDAQAETYAKFSQSQDEVWPIDEPAWKDALKKTLTPPQAAAWENAEAKHKQTAQAEIGDYLNNVVRRSSAQERSRIEPKLLQVKQSIDLPKDRLARLNALAESVISQYGEATRVRSEKDLLAMDDEERKAMTGQRGGYSWSWPAQNTAWEDGLARLLSPDELKRLQSGAEDRKTRHAHAMGELLLALLDEKIAFTDAQRQQLQPIAWHLVEKQPQLAGDQDQNNENFFSYPLSSFYAAAAPTDEVKAILDPIQWQHWQQLSTLKDQPDPSMMQDAQSLPPPDDPAKPHPPPEPEDVEHSISDFLEQKSAAERQTILSTDILKAEDVARVVHPPADVAERLQTAARGTAEQFLTAWDANIEQMVRSSLGDATPESVKQRLASIERYQFQQNFQGQDGRLKELSAWDKTLKATLTQDQQDAWKKETDARDAYRQKAIADVILSSFGQKIGISPDQEAKLKPMLVKSVNDYSADFGRFFAFSSRWYLQGFYLFLPVAAIPEKDLKAILTKEQWDRWTGSQEFSNVANYWNMINNNHQARVVHTVKQKVKVKPTP